MSFRKPATLLLLTVLSLLLLKPVQVGAVTQVSGSIGIEGKVGAPPPTTGATITFPSNGQVFTNSPITVSGICPEGLLVEIFRNNVFGGSVICKNGSFSLQIDLFSQRNDLVARVFDALDQPGPDSATVTVTLDDVRPGTAPRVGLTSNYAKRGAEPGKSLTWPLILNGGTGPYAVSVDWGDGKAPDLMSLAFSGNFDASHIYDKAGVYNIIAKAADRDGITAYLQIVGVGNGPILQDTTKTEVVAVQKEIMWWPAAIMFPLIIVAFLLGDRASIRRLRKQLNLDRNQHL